MVCHDTFFIGHTVGPHSGTTARAMEGTAYLPVKHILSTPIIESGIIYNSKQSFHYHTLVAAKGDNYQQNFIERLTTEGWIGVFIQEDHVHA